MKQLYYDPKHPISFSGPLNLYHWMKRHGYDISYKTVKQWLQDQEPYSLQKGVRRRFKRSQVIVSGIDDQWDADLMDMSNVAQYNEGIRYILVIIDIFSKYSKPIFRLIFHRRKKIKTVMETEKRYLSRYKFIRQIL